MKNLFKSLSISGLSLFLLFSSCTQIPVIPKSDKEVGQIYGPVCQITEIWYLTEKIGNVIKVGKGTRMSISDYNEAGNIICQRNYRTGNVFKDSSVYTYDVYDRLVKCSKFEKELNTDNIMYFWNGRKAINISRNESVGELEYDKDGNLICVKKLGGDNKYVISKSKYDEFGREIENYESYNGKTSHIKFTYKKGVKIAYDYKDRFGITTHYYYKNYLDKYHNVIWSFRIKNKGEVCSCIKYIIKYRK